MKILSVLVPLMFALPIGQTAAVEGSWKYGISALSSQFKPEVINEGIDTKALGVGLYGDYLNQGLLATIAMDIVSYDDHQSFSQSVVGSGAFNSGDYSTASSEATGVLISVAAGKAIHLGASQKTMAYVQGGFDMMLESSRGIANCSNCDQESIDVEGGIFINAGVDYELNDFIVGFSVKVYPASDSINNSIALSFGVPFG